MGGQDRGSECVVVVGGANTDIVGRTFAPLHAHDSNPGCVTTSSGGVGRNVAENLVRLGVSTHLITAFGSDRNALDLAEECRHAGVGLEHSLNVAELPGSVYLAILDDSGEMEVALSDMRPLDAITPDALRERRVALECASLIVLDANIAPESLQWLCTEVDVPIVLDPVSAAKAPRAREVLGRIAALKCNALEASELLGMAELKSPAQVEYAAEKLVEAGVRTVFVTADAHGVCYRGDGEHGWLARPDAPIVNATGAGDAFTAGVAAAMLEGMDVRSCAAFGTVMAASALSSESTVSQAVDREWVRAQMGALL